MKLKEIHEFVNNIVTLLNAKADTEAREEKLPETTREYTKGQLYEATYILEVIEEIIYKDK